MLESKIGLLKIQTFMFIQVKAVIFDSKISHRRMSEKGQKVSCITLANNV
jgi:hypothetical protein